MFFQLSNKNLDYAVWFALCLHVGMEKDWFSHLGLQESWNDCIPAVEVVFSQSNDFFSSFMILLHLIHTHKDRKKQKGRTN